MNKFQNARTAYKLFGTEHCQYIYTAANTRNNAKRKAHACTVKLRFDLQNATIHCFELGLFYVFRLTFDLWNNSSNKSFVSE